MNGSAVSQAVRRVLVGAGRVLVGSGAVLAASADDTELAEPLDAGHAERPLVQTTGDEER